MSDAPPAPDSPQSLLAQMEQMLAALNADLVQLDADLQMPESHATGSDDAAQQPDELAHE
ncbi:hypothetical protein [Streptacidiphilus fuscans]|uniref:Uncharacterized protein n=1 Tax=Streptacidiphilus fuscans TaxID=2789292 RepID=A0A931B7B4_9ACTN|nr:hypothetical protein [Streptacidiphilus fuscans]MBF9071471.1 hypothetical protein [Streptacidiphilus fuscans]